jgi:hypothetical protein
MDYATEDKRLLPGNVAMFHRNLLPPYSMTAAGDSETSTHHYTMTCHRTTTLTIIATMTSDSPTAVSYRHRICLCVTFAKTNIFHVVKCSREKGGTMDLTTDLAGPWNVPTELSPPPPNKTGLKKKILSPKRSRTSWDEELTASHLQTASLEVTVAMLCKITTHTNPCGFADTYQCFRTAYPRRSECDAE